MKWIAVALIALAAAAATGFAAFQLSPWPSVLLIRHAFSTDAERRNEALAKHRPAGVTALRDQAYGAGSAEAIDVFFPAADSGHVNPTVVWIHGGAFIAGSRGDVAPYLEILAARGYTAIAVGYTTAPEAMYPTPVVEGSAALAFILANAERFHVDTERIFLAGDSAGAQIAAELALALGDPAFARALGLTSPTGLRLRGIALFCGIYDAGGVKLDGPFGGFLRTAIWSYFGSKDPSPDDPRLDAFSVARHVTADFPPAFVSVGNADPLGSQSTGLAEALAKAGASVDTLFFPGDSKPPLPHEYQFNLDTAAGAEALDRLTAFLKAHSG